MRKVNFKGRCERRVLSKCKSVFKSYDPIQNVFADKLEANIDIAEIQYKVTEVYYNAKEPTAEVYTHDTKLKKRLLAYAAKFPELRQQTDDDEQGGLRFEIDKSRISIRPTAPYSTERRTALKNAAKTENLY